MSVLDMKEYKQRLVNEYRDAVKNLDKKELWILTDGVDKQCATYMKSKLKWGAEVGLEVKVVTVDSLTHLKQLCEDIKNEDIAVIMQLPIKNEYKEYYNEIRLKSDVDGFFSYQSIAEGDYSVVPATPKACLNYLKEGLELELRGKNIVIVGRGMLVGYPLAMMMMNEGATVSVINTKTERSLRETLLRKADIVVCATGHKGSVKIWELSERKDVYVLNVGTCFDSNGKLTTELEIDYDRENVYYTPRLGGIGVITVLSLIDNVINYYKK